ncbi:MAG: LysM peptidoglycan-binding domain-containing protein [Bacteroidales bacterium]|nr:LysM peptidoglycan-binding domain-containing protein [Bacteroidales bacterium]
MKKLYLLILILFTITGSASAQNTIELSNEKVKIDGNYFYAHTVKKKETLYSLGRAYGVTVDVIVKNNSSLATGLKEDAVIYIPVVEQGKPAAGNVKQTSAKKKKYRRHTVKWYEDITDISEKYNVPVESIIALNNLPNGKLKSRQVLQIPDADYIASFIVNRGKSYGQTPQQDSVMTVTADSTAGIIADSVVTLTGKNLSGRGEIAERKSGEKLEIALVLPLNSSNPENLSSNFMDFYAGALMAVNDIKDPDLTVNVYDLTEYTPLHTLLDVPGFDNNQLIIGPARSSRLKEFTGYATTHRIPLVSPLDNSAEHLVEECKYMVQVPAPIKYQLENVVNQLKEQYLAEPAPVLLITEKNGSDAIYAAQAKRLLDSLGIPHHDISYGILEGRTISETLVSIVDTLNGTPNLALVPSNSEAFVSDVVRNLDICHNYGNTRMIAFGLPKWRNFETINVELFHKLNLHLSIPYFVDYSQPEVNRFLLAYRALYNTEPTPYAYQGYDITKYFIDLAKRYGRSFINLTDFPSAQMLQCNFELRPAGTESQGITNVATRNIVYNPDYTITLQK